MVLLVAMTLSAAPRDDLRADASPSSPTVLFSASIDWKPGNDVIIVPAVSNEEAKQKYPAGWNTVLPYLRIVAQPQ